MEEKYYTKICPFCKGKFSPSDTIAVCGICDTPHHIECWQENGKCTTFGCTGKIQKILSPTEAAGIRQAARPSAAPSPQFIPQAPLGNMPFGNTASGNMPSGNATAQPVQQGIRPAAGPSGSAYETLYTNKASQWCKGSPVTLEKITVLGDHATLQIFANCLFRSLTKKKIISVTVDIETKDIFGQTKKAAENFAVPAGIAKENSMFGEGCRIPLNSMACSEAAVILRSVTYFGGTTEDFSDQMTELKRGEALSAYFGDAEQVKEYERELGSKAALVPFEQDGLWCCTCGTYNLSENEKCSVCGAEREKQIKLLDKAHIKEETEKYLEKKRAEEEQLRQEQEKKRKEAEERYRAEQERIQKAEEEEREKQRIAAEAARKKRNAAVKKTVAIVASILLVAGLGIVTVKVIIPSVKYNNAVAGLAAGEYDAAAQAFRDLGDYKDSAQKVTECETAKQQARYAEAEALFAEKKYEDAKKIFSELGSFSDSSKRVKECETCIADEKYDAADKLFRDGKYEEAKKEFASFNGYKDSKKRVTECDYRIAVKAFEAGNYEEAKALFDDISGYEDSKDRSRECTYIVAGNAFKAKDYDTAYNYYHGLGKYKDSADQADECRYQQGLILYDKKDFDASNKIFKDLAAHDYKDSKKMIHEHSYKQEVTKQPTCTEKGIMQYTCSCGKSYTESLKALGHDYSQVAVAREATCTVPGLRTYTCRCGDSRSEDIPATGHSYQSSVTRAATCEQEGLTTYSCHCGDTYTESIPKTSHHYVAYTCWDIPTCEFCGKQDGHKEIGHTTKRGVCERCGLYIRDGQEWADYDDWFDNSDWW